MKISFYEEFCEDESLTKSKLINFPSKLYLAASSIDKFKKYRKEASNKFIKEFVWWPVMKIEEGYWVSPWTKRKALLRIFNEVKDNKVMLDLEIPKDRSLLLKNCLNFFRNKKLIMNFVKRNKDKVYCCEYFGDSDFLRKLGLSYDSKHNNIIKMVYRSVHHISDDMLKHTLNKYIKKFGKRFIVSFGTIATGMTGRETIMTPSELERDLKIAEECGVEEVIIFRLGGLNKEYVKILNKFVP